MWFFLQHQNFLTVFFVCFFTQGLIDQPSVNTCTDPDDGTSCNTYIADAATCTSMQRTDGSAGTCVFAPASTGNTCTSAGNAGTTCDAHNADESTCTTEPRTDNAGATCVFVAPTSPRVPVPNPCSGNPCTATNDATTCCKPSAFCSSMTTVGIVEVCKGTLYSINIYLTKFCWLLLNECVFSLLFLSSHLYSYLFTMHVYQMSSYEVSWGLIPAAQASTTYCEGVICGPVDAQCCISQAPCSSVSGAALGSLCASHGGNGLVDNPPRTDTAGATCVFDGNAGTCTDPDGGTTCNAHNANSATCISKPALCAGVPCAATDSATCCKPSAKCSSMSIAKVKNVCGNSGSLVANPSTVSCNGLLCTSADKVQCCQPSQLCSAMTVPQKESVCAKKEFTLVVDASTTFCNGIACAAVDKLTCCLPDAPCSSLTTTSEIENVCGTGGALIPATVAATTMCGKATCGASDKGVCCVAPMLCSAMNAFQVQNICGVAGALVPAASSTSCVGLVCTATDKDTCCLPDAMCSSLKTAIEIQNVCGVGVHLIAGTWF